MNNTPFVSCICPTYGRCPEYQFLIEEAIESFDQQDYPADKRELLIVNDCPQQVLKCDTPGVRCINLLSRIPSLGEKYNISIQSARGEYIFPWEDDDISLPHRISQGVETITSQEADYWNPRNYLFLQKTGGIRTDHPIGVCHNCSVYSKRAWKLVGGYPHVSGAQDAMMDTALKQHLEIQLVDSPLAVENSSYIYRWGVQPLHLSGKQPHDEFYAEVGKMQFASGYFQLKPQWKRAYTTLAEEAVNDFLSGVVG